MSTFEEEEVFSEEELSESDEELMKLFDKDLEMGLIEDILDEGEEEEQLLEEEFVQVVERDEDEPVSIFFNSFPENMGEDNEDDEEDDDFDEYDGLDFVTIPDDNDDDDDEESDWSDDDC